MDDRRKTVAAITLIVVFTFLVVLIAGIVLTRKKSIVSPVPEEGAIRIIFVSPTTTPLPSTAVTPSPTTKPKATATPRPTKSASPSATP